MFLLSNRRAANSVGFLICVSLIAYALYAQYVQLLDPCPLCLFQRFAIMGVGAIFLVATLHNPDILGARVYAILIMFASLGGILIATRHLWIQSQPAGSVAACGASLGYLFDIMSFTDVIKKVFSGSGECAKVEPVLGISMPWWVIVWLVILSAWGLITNWRARP